MKIFKRNNDKRRIDGMSSRQKADMIRRLESERRKINSEIEGILRSYAKESGNSALRRKGVSFGKSVDEMLNIYEE